MEEVIKDFRRSHNTYKFIVVIVIVGSLVITLAAISYGYKMHKNSLNSIWIVKDGRAYNTEYRNNQFSYPERPFEYEQLAREYHFNRYSGDRYSYSENFAQCLEYCSKDLQERVYVEYTDDDMERTVEEKDWRYQSYVDSVYLAPPDYKIGALWGKQSIITGKRRILRKMCFKFSVQDLNVRSKKNHLGAILTDIDVFNNEVIENEN